MNCCATCIGDFHLRTVVVPSISRKRGECSYCFSRNQPLVDPVDLRDLFELVLGIYRKSTKGRTLVEWLKDDWGMFDHPKLDGAHAKELLGDILDDGDIVRQKFAPMAYGGAAPLAKWELFRQEIMERNRYFLKPILDLDRLRDLLDYVIAPKTDVPRIFFRARIQDDETPFAIAEMGVPPALRATHGRANSVGIPYLYLATDTATAISELRPHTGDYVSVVEVEVPRTPRLADLRNPTKKISPFAFSDEAEINLLRHDVAFLARLGYELTKPVRPKSAHIAYLPSQYLCEFIKHCGFDGVMYRSSVGTGTNVALFAWPFVKFRRVRRHVVSRVWVEAE
jgi:hypothetical protein